MAEKRFSLPQVLRKMLTLKNMDDAIANAQKGGLEKTLGVWDLIILGVGAIIGSGIFAIVGVAAAGSADGSSPGAGPALVISMVIAAIACILAGTSARRNAAYAAPYGNYGAPGYAAQPYVQPYAGVAAQPGEVQQQYAQPYAGVAGQPAAAQSGGEAVPADRGAEKTEK